MLSVQTRGHKIRVRGDLHLGKVLDVGKDIVFLDFEGDHTQPFVFGRLKRSPLLDVAAMKYSLHYVAFTGLKGTSGGMHISMEALRRHRKSIAFWSRHVEAAFTEDCWRVARSANLVPSRKADLVAMLSVYVLAKSFIPGRL